MGVAVREKRRDRVNWFLTPSQPQRRTEQETRKLYFTRKREEQVGVAMLESSSLVSGFQNLVNRLGQFRMRENSNSKTLFYKDCSLGSVKNLTISPC